MTGRSDGKREQDWGKVPRVVAEPDFNNLLTVLQCEKPARATLFEFFLNDPLYRRLAGLPEDEPADLAQALTVIHAFRNAGYDYATYDVPDFGFPAGEVPREQTISLNEGAVIVDRKSFDSYQWPDPEKTVYANLDRLEPEMPKGMKLIVPGPCGVLENAIRLMGYEHLCMTIQDDDRLVSDVFEQIGSRMVRYYERCLEHKVVGAIVGNDDWGFKSQTMLSPRDMRRFVFPWHKQIVAAAHLTGRPAILHSCGYLTEVLDDIVEDMGYDGKHSYEDVIEPVEQAYDQYRGRIAVMGGIDLDFVCRSEPGEIYKRSSGMIERSARDGGYALGTGNSVPKYVPDDHYFAMIRAAIDCR